MEFAKRIVHYFVKKQSNLDFDVQKNIMVINDVKISNINENDCIEIIQLNNNSNNIFSNGVIIGNNNIVSNNSIIINGKLIDGELNKNNKTIIKVNKKTVYKSTDKLIKIEITGDIKKIVIPNSHTTVTANQIDKVQVDNGNVDVETQLINSAFTSNGNVKVQKIFNLEENVFNANKSIQIQINGNSKSICAYNGNLNVKANYIQSIVSNNGNINIKTKSINCAESNNGKVNFVN